MEAIFRIFMYILPYALSIAAYIWVGKKALHTSNKIAKVIAFIILACGLGYTLYKMGTSISKALTDDRFEFGIMIVNVFVLFFAAIAIALGQPEEADDKSKTNKL